MNKKNIDTYSISDLENKIKQDIFNLSSKRGGIYLKVYDYESIGVEITINRFSNKISELKKLIGLTNSTIERTRRGIRLIFDNKEVWTMKKREHIATKWDLSLFSSYSINHNYIFHNIYNFSYFIKGGF